MILRNDDFRYRDELIEAFERGMAESIATSENPWEHISVAMGIAVYDPSQGRPVMDTVREADKMMYINKKNRKAEEGPAAN